MRNIILLIGLSLSLVACGINADLSFVTNPGDCASFNLESTVLPESAPGPYCMQVTITNNGGGQNFINSTTAAITNISMSMTGASNINSPATTSNTMDPNNCQGSTINPGGSCAFYLQISTESYPVNQAESVILTLNYNVNNTLFGGGNATGSSSLNFYEVTNLYLPEASGNLAILNSSSTPFTTRVALKPGNNIMASAVDNSNYGYLYLGANGLYQYGEESTTPSIGPPAFSTPVNNLINYGTSSIYAATSTGNFSSIYQWSLSSNAWSSTSSLFTVSSALSSNINAVSLNGTTYLVGGSGGVQVFNCTNPTTVNGSATACNTEGANLPTKINALAALSYTSTASTGLYAGTSSGLYAESAGATTATNTWHQVTDLDGKPIQEQINAFASDSSGNLYIGDSNAENSAGNIWLMTKTSGAVNQVSNLYTLAGTGIQTMKVDTVSNTLYFVNTSGQLFSCNLGTVGTTPSCLPSAISEPNALGTVVGMQIGSELKASL